MKKQIRDILRLLRPRQWVKNFAIFAAITFNGGLTDITVVLNVFYGFLIFCAISSAIYIINDIFDVEKDRLHPFKRFRPLANKDITIRFAVFLACLIGISSLIGSLAIAPAFFAITLVYLLLQLFYSMFLKHIAVIDILALASGYILRVYAGEVIGGIQFHTSVWL